MTTDTLALFARQLSLWAQRIIDNGRSPFRKVESYPSLVTAAGIVRPPLVFWINRQSLMAGGLIFLPPQRADEGINEAACCARAVGLGHFVAWAPAEIVFWEIHDNDVRRGKSIALNGSEQLDIERFRDELSLVMNELKLLSVTGAVAPPKLSAYYLANLCLGYLQESQSPLTETFRIARGQDLLRDGDMDPDTWAFRRAALSLFQLLGLLQRDLLPDSVQPERLEQAMALHLPTLPAGLSPLPNQEPELPLPEPVAVRLHHLFRRLGQIGWQRDSQRAQTTLQLLLEHLGSWLGGFPLPAPKPAVQDPANALLVNPRTTAWADSAISLSASPALLAGLAVERDVLGRPELEESAAGPLELPASAESFSLVCGSLTCRTPAISRAQRRQAEAALRRSWPTRRFVLPGRLPRWGFELLHLLGLTSPGGHIRLRLPEAWLDSELSKPIFGLLEEQFLLRRIEPESDSIHIVDIVRRPGTEAPLTVTVAGENRTIPEGLAGRELRARLQLALHLSEKVYSLVETERLQIPAEADWQELPVEGARLFVASTLGRGLWQSVGGGRLQNDDITFVQKAIHCGCPMPTSEVLALLQRLGEEAPTSAEVERELAFWLETELKDTKFGRNPGSTRSRRRAPSKAKMEKPHKAIAARVFIDGIPRFPQQYLFDHYRPELIEYNYNGPLCLVSTFFNTAELRDRAGKTFEVEGEETARALVLASYGNLTGVALPAERRLTAKILERYCHDLMQLRQQLLQEAHSQLGDAPTADALVERIWQDKSLPPWNEIGPHSR